MDARIFPVSHASWRGLQVKIIKASPGRFEAPPREHPRLMVHLGAPARTSGGYDGADRPRVQSRGDIDIVPAGSGGLWQDEDPTSTMSIWLGPSLLSRAAAGARAAPRLETQQRDPQLFRLALMLKEEARNSDAADPLFIDGLGAALAARLLGRCGHRRFPRVVGELSRPKLKRVLDYIEDNISNDISVETLAELANASPSHFRLLFRRSVGRPVHRYIIEKRVERAGLLLRSGRVSISQAAYESGFCDQGHMARRMRQVLGLAPSDLWAAGARP